jgi:DNA (cytosine-5)-methyltransferase 1
VKAISLFSGAGGCSLGFCQSGVDIIAAYDNNISAIETYNTNFGDGKCHEADLATCDFSAIRHRLGLKIGDIDLIIGGPPCQGFTTAGNRFWDDPRNKLIQNYALALESFRPRWFVMENVEGILTAAKGEYLLECIKKMASLGYSVCLEKVYAQEYGVPQRRKRVILIGNIEGKKFSFPPSIKKAYGAIYKNGTLTLRDAISDLEGKLIPSIDHIPKYEKDIRLERITALREGQTMKDLPEYLQHDSFKRRANRRVCDGTPTEKRGGAPSGLKRLIYDEPSLTITSASPSDFIHPREDRALTIRECARIQTFPDNYVFCGTESQKAIQVGNAIPPVLAKSLATQIIKCDAGEFHSVKAGLVSYKVTKAEAMSPLLKSTCVKLNAILTEKYEQMELSYVY